MTAWTPKRQGVKQYYRARIKELLDQDSPEADDQIVRAFAVLAKLKNQDALDAALDFLDYVPRPQRDNEDVEPVATAELAAQVLGSLALPGDPVKKTPEQYTPEDVQKWRQWRDARGRTLQGE